MTAPLTEQEKKIRVITDLRSEMTHEDNMINNRMTWFSMMQGFLFTSFALSMKSDLSFASLPIAAVGILTSVVFIISIKAAINAFNKYQKNYVDLYREVFLISENMFNNDDMKNGFYAPKYVPYILLLTWLTFISHLVLTSFLK